ncbi:MAG: hypothetical protein Ta2A_16890 [Treponemataceae bacterium]|nr:MAG: hypothetical protein Ta2A_16890 [Treponemataceae bacterium]
MKKRHGLLFGSAALLITALFTMASCGRPVESPSRRVELPDPANPDIKAKFGVSTASQAFTKLHRLISGPKGAYDFTKVIALGDYIDLPALAVAGYPIDEADTGSGSPGYAMGKINVTNDELSGHGRLLRLIVVGINSFNGINGNNTPHVVFQFQNVPVTHRMNASNTSVGGYKESQMRSYLIYNFFAGLTDAGVPANLLWTPKRIVWNGFLSGENGASSANTVVDTIKDKIFLPTDWEMFGGNEASSPTYETVANQGRLDYYKNADHRIKYNSSNAAAAYWLASPHFTQKGYFCNVRDNGDAATINASSPTRFVAPAFCIK